MNIIRDAVPFVQEVLASQVIPVSNEETPSSSAPESAAVDPLIEFADINARVDATQDRVVAFQNNIDILQEKQDEAQEAQAADSNVEMVDAWADIKSSAVALNALMNGKQQAP